MSFKGITWAGNVYEKFEAMCLEVEEALYQDTVKYMENQVQKVGVSVKKFCSEVMDDVRPLSCIDPTGLASDDLSHIPCGYTDINKKPKEGTFNRLDLKKRENEDTLISSATAEKGSSLSGCDVKLFSPQSPRILVEDTSPGKGVASKKIGVQRRLIGIKRISKSNQPLKDSSRNTSISEDRRRKLVNCDVRTSSLVDSDNLGATLSSEFERRREALETDKGTTPDFDNRIKLPASNKILLSESVRQDSSRATCDDSCLTSSSNTVMHGNLEEVKGNVPLQNNVIEAPASENVSLSEYMKQVEDAPHAILPESTSSSSGSPAEYTGASVNDIVAESSSRSKVCNLENEEEGATSSEEGTSMKDGLSIPDSTSCTAASCNEEFIMSNKECFDIEFVEIEARLDKFESNGRHDLEESCILVDGEEFHCSLQRTKKQKSYKKRIREALLSKLRSRKGEQLLCLHKGDKSMADHVRVVDSQEHKVSAGDSVEESDWELL